MTLDEFRMRIEEFRRAADEEAMTLKDSYLALERLHRFYASLSPNERTLASLVLAEWVVSPDEKTRFDALALVRDFRIVTVIPALRDLAARLAGAETAGAPFELQKVKGILRDLGDIAPRHHE